MNIIITEQQLDIIKKLVESDSIMLDDGNTDEYGDTDKISTSATITDADGNITPGKDVYADEISKFEANNDWRNTVISRFY